MGDVMGKVAEKAAIIHLMVMLQNSFGTPEEKH
jgi:hypothetical protein